MALRPVTVFALGGTIAMTSGAEGRAVPAISADALAAAVPGLERIARVTAVDFRQLPGAHLTLDDILALARAISAAAEAGAAGAVVTQGTDTIEETAFALDLLIGPDLPVVVTGAMRHAGMAGAEGPANLLAAVAVAAAEDARGLGTVVVMNDTIHAAVLVHKAHSTRPDAFASPTAGPIGFIAEGVPHILLRPAARARVPMPGEGADRPVALLASGLGDDGRLIGAVAAGGFAGAVIAATGAGHLSEAAADAAADLAQAMPVVLASRTGAGPVLAGTYGFAGSESDLAARGLIRAGWLDPAKARVLLALALRAGFDEAWLRTAFAAYGGG
jgi:L-asparaginase